MDRKSLSPGVNVIEQRNTLNITLKVSKVKRCFRAYREGDFNNLLVIINIQKKIKVYFNFLGANWTRPLYMAVTVLIFIGFS